MKLLLTLLLCCLSTIGPVLADPQFSLVSKIKIGGEGGWDYLTFDGPSHRLFITRETHVQVFDVRSGRVVGDIPGTAGVHGVAIAAPEHRGFTSNGRADTATMFDLGTLKPLAQIKVGQKPDAIVYDASTHRVAVMNGKSDDITFIDAAAGRVVGTVALGGGPESAATDGQGHLFVAIEDKNEIVEVDARNLKLLTRFPVAPGDEPTGLAMDRAGHRLFAGCHNQKMVVVDSRSHKVLADLPIGAGVDTTAWDDHLGMAFNANGDGTLTVVGNNGTGAVQNVATMRGARTMALDPATHRIYLVTAVPEYLPTPEERRQGKRPKYSPDSFTVLVVAPQK